MYEKLKSFVADDSVFYAILLVLIGVAAFGLGRQSMMSETPQSRGVTLTQAVIEPESLQLSDQQVVVSKNGTKYHLLSCPGASQISEKNKLTFESPQQAQAAGYEPAANCPGLE